MSGTATIVFGGSSGIGLATVKRLLAAGHRVAAISNDPQGLASLPRGAVGIEADVANDEHVAAAVASAVVRFGGLSNLVYSAGIQTYGSVVDTPLDRWERTIAINLTGAYLAARHTVPHLPRGGAIVLVSSVQAIACQQGVAAYAAAKGGLNALGRAMALDHAAEGIRVNTVCPGSVDTPMLAASADLFRGRRQRATVLDEWGAAHPLGRIADAGEVAAVIAFLLSADAQFMSGSEVRVDGALTAGLAVRAAER